jgi:putative transposase
MLASWRADYNVNRPHSGLGWQTPAEFAHSFPRREPTLRNPASSAPDHAAQLAQQRNSNRQSELKAG